MSSVRMVAYSYLALGLYALLAISVTTLELWHLLPALLQLLLCAFAFATGYFGRRVGTTPAMLADPQRRKRRPLSTMTCLALGSAVLISSSLSTGYFTGMTPGDVFSHIEAGDSLYAEYQRYNSALAIRGGTGLSTWFGLLIFKTATMLGVVFSIIPRGDRILPREWLLLGCVILSFAYSGLARGTGLEFFQVGIALLVAVLTRYRRRRFSIVRTFLPLGVGICLAWLYSSLLTARGVTNPALGPGNDVRFEDSWLADLLGPGIVRFFMKFFDYFGFGFQYVATFWSDVWTVSPGNMFAGMVPGGYYAAGIDPLIVIRQSLEMGPRWHPDSIRIVSVLGVTGLLLVCFVLGHVARNLESRSTLTSRIVQYFVIMQMISLPIGNFVWVDRSGLIVAVWLVGIELLRGWGAISPTFAEFFGRGQMSQSSRTAVRSTRSGFWPGGARTSGQR